MDVLIATKRDLTHHRQIVDDILDFFTSKSYFLHPSKCVFEQTHIKYLGIVVNGDKLSMDPKKTAGLRDWPQTLTTVKEVHSVLGVLGYQCTFIPNFTNIARPLTSLTKKDHPFLWTPKC